MAPIHTGTTAKAIVERLDVTWSLSSGTWWHVQPRFERLANRLLAAASSDPRCRMEAEGARPEWGTGVRSRSIRRRDIDLVVLALWRESGHRWSGEQCIGLEADLGLLSAPALEDALEMADFLRALAQPEPVARASARNLPLTRRRLRPGAGA